MEFVDWTTGVPRSPRFDDVYHSTSGALAQAGHVFLGGCGLPEAWRGQRQWRILETGFGLGLNFLATWQAWRDDPHRPGRLVFESVEAWPVTPADIRRAARADAGLAGLVPLADALADGLAAAAAWALGKGRVRLALDEERVELNIQLGDIVAIAGGEPWQGQQEADSIFLDGFSPARNPAIWSPVVLAALGRRARPGAGLATWTVAAVVRRGLDEAGFEVARRPGLPPKRHCLAGRRRPGA